MIVVRARTRDEAVACPRCGAETARVHGYYERMAADVPVDGRCVMVRVRVRRMRCPVLGCQVQTFREQVPGVLERYQRRISRLTAQVSAVARELAGRASARLLPALGVMVSRHTALRVLLKVPLPGAAVPRVLGIDDFALRRGLVYATVLIDAETGRRVDVVPGRTTDVAETWLRGHPGIEVVCRDGSGATARQRAGRCRRRCRSATGGICGTSWARLPAKRSWRTPAAGPTARPCRKANGPIPPGNAGSRSVTCGRRAQACWTAPAAWACP